MCRCRSAIPGVLVLLLILAGCAPAVGAPSAVPTSSAAKPSATVPATPTAVSTALPSPTAAPLATSTLLPTPASAPTLAPTAVPTATQAPPTGAATAPGPQGQAGAHVFVEMKNYAFMPKDITVAPGTTVTWRNDDSTTHTATADDKLFDSGNMGPGAQFSYSFAKPGVYPYYCIWHGAPGGQGMAGTVTVK